MRKFFSIRVWWDIVKTFIEVLMKPHDGDLARKIYKPEGPADKVERF
ncbi:MAG: hypothetical protein AAB428_03025 [Patescibacteria group bacterium]